MQPLYTQLHIVPPISVIKDILSAALFVLPLVFGIRLLSADQIKRTEWRQRLYALIPLKRQTFDRCIKSIGVVLLVVSLLMAWVLIQSLISSDS